MPRLALPALLPAAALAAAFLPAPAAAQAGDGLPSECALAMADAFTTAREAEGLSGIVSADQIAEFERRCAGLAPDADRFVAGHDDIDRAARAGINLFAIPEVRTLYSLLMPQGNAGAGVPIPAGSHISASNGLIALTRVCEDSARDSMCRNHTTVLFDLVVGTTIACQRIWSSDESPTVWWTFNQANAFEDPDGRWCPTDPAEVPPEVLEYWAGYAPAPQAPVRRK